MTSTATATAAGTMLDIHGQSSIDAVNIANAGSVQGIQVSASSGNVDAVLSVVDGLR